MLSLPNSSPRLASIHNYMGGEMIYMMVRFLGGYMDFNEGKESITSNAEFAALPFQKFQKTIKIECTTIQSSQTCSLVCIQSMSCII